MKRSFLEQNASSVMFGWFITFVLAFALYGPEELRRQLQALLTPESLLEALGVAGIAAGVFAGLAAVFLAFFGVVMLYGAGDDYLAARFAAFCARRVPTAMRAAGRFVGRLTR